MIFHDKSGRPLRAGDYIIYATKCGSSPEFTYGRVVGIKSTERKNYKGTLYTQIKLKIHSCAFYKGTPSKTLPDGTKTKEYPSTAHLAGRVSYLEHEDRVLAISGDQMPEIVLSELASLAVDRNS